MIDVLPKAKNEKTILEGSIDRVVKNLSNEALELLEDVVYSFVTDHSHLHVQDCRGFYIRHNDNKSEQYLSKTVKELSESKLVSIHKDSTNRDSFISVNSDVVKVIQLSFPPY